jgi:hypothetical protein
MRLEHQVRPPSLIVPGLIVAFLGLALGASAAVTILLDAAARLPAAHSFAEPAASDASSFGPPPAAPAVYGEIVPGEVLSSSRLPGRCRLARRPAPRSCWAARCPRHGGRPGSARPGIHRRGSARPGIHRRGSARPGIHRRGSARPGAGCAGAPGRRGAGLLGCGLGHRDGWPDVAGSACRAAAGDLPPRPPLTLIVGGLLTAQGEQSSHDHERPFPAAGAPGRTVLVVRRMPEWPAVSTWATRLRSGCRRGRADVSRAG